MHASSQGKAILSAMPVYEAEALLRRRPLQVCTPHTVTAPEQLLAQLPAIRRGGYAEEHEEYRLGLKSVAAPIYEGDGHAATSSASSALPEHRLQNSPPCEPP